jgi:hypothetical protein
MKAGPKAAVDETHWSSTRTELTHTVSYCFGAVGPTLTSPAAKGATAEAAASSTDRPTIDPSLALRAQEDRRDSRPQP